MALFSTKEQEKNAKSPLREAIVMPPPEADKDAPYAAAPAPASSPKQPSVMTAPSDARAYLDSGSKISGKLYFDGPARIDGQVEGEVSAKESLSIGESAVVNAQLRAASVIVAGKVTGDITAGSRIEIRPSARVMGNLTAPVLVVHEGAHFEGHCTMSPEVVHDERPNRVAVLREERIAQVAGSKQG